MKKNRSALPLVLLILDGWGINRQKVGNAILLAKTPNLDKLMATSHVGQLQASGLAVGLPAGQAGNSEAGHLNIGAGRIVESDALRINRDIKNGTFFKHSAFISAVNHVRKNHSALHVMALLSGPNSPHVDFNHLLAFAKFLKQQKITRPIFWHIITDGRDAGQFEAVKFLETWQAKTAGLGQVATVMGRFYAMDRKKYWARTKLAYQAMVMGRGKKASTANQAITQAYQKGQSDEFISPTVIVKNNHPVGMIDNDDAIVFLNLRSDRARQLAKPFVQPHFEKKGGFSRGRILKNTAFVALTDFGPDLDSIITAYPSLILKNTLPAALSDLRQLYIAESEKYAHVTYFINGGYAQPIDGEKRLRVASPRAKNYNLEPAMAAEKISQSIVRFLRNKKYDVMVANFANADMVGHTGDLPAAIAAVTKVDEEIGKIFTAVKKVAGTLVITADHGTAEEMIDRGSKLSRNSHTTNPVPFIIAGRGWSAKKIKNGILANIAPTILDIVGKPCPPEMTKKSLL